MGPRAGPGRSPRPRRREPLPLVGGERPGNSRSPQPRARRRIGPVPRPLRGGEGMERQRSRRGRKMGFRPDRSQSQGFRHDGRGRRDVGAGPEGGDALGLGASREGSAGQSRHRPAGRVEGGFESPQETFAWLQSVPSSPEANSSLAGVATYLVEENPDFAWTGFSKLPENLKQVTPVRSLRRSGRRIRRRENGGSPSSRTGK